MNFPVITLAALVAIFPLSSFAQEPVLGCLLDGVLVVGEVIEGNGNANTIDCSSSEGPHNIFGYGGDDLLIGSDGNDFIAGGGGNDTILGGAGDDAIDGGATDDWVIPPINS
jgi:Ca2+-binding RTX toxin-like protein